MALTPEIPMVNAGLLYVNGLQLTNDATTPNTVFNVAAGACRDSSNINDIVISSSVAVSTARVGVRGLDVGTIAASSLYAVYAIGSSANQLGNGQSYSAYPGTVVISADFTKPVLPFGYDMYRRIGTIATDNASAIRLFVQAGTGSVRTMWYGSPIATLITAGASTTYASIGLNAVSLVVPAQVCIVHLDITLTPQAAGNKVTLKPATSGTSTNYASLSGDVAAVAHNDMLSCVTGISGNFSALSYKVSNAGDAVAISVRGFEDNL